MTWSSRTSWPAGRHGEPGGLHLEERLAIFPLADHLVLQVFLADDLALRHQRHAALVDAGLREPHDLLATLLDHVDEVRAGDPIELLPERLFIQPVHQLKRIPRRRGGYRGFGGIRHRLGHVPRSPVPVHGTGDGRPLRV